MLHDKATTSQPLGRCFDSRGGGGGSRALRSPFGQPSAPRSSARRGRRPTPAPLREPFVPLSAGGKLCFPATPSKRGVRAAPAIADAGESQQPVCPGSGAAREQAPRSFAGGASWCAFLIPPHHLKERARNFTANRTCSVYRRTPA